MIETSLVAILTVMEHRLIARLAPVAARLPGLDLLLVHGSSAQDTDHDGSDLDLGYVGGADFDPATAHSKLVAAAGREDVDLVDLSRANAVLRYRAAAEAVVVFERRPGAFLDFAEAAVQFHADVSWVLRRAHRQVLESLG